MGQITVSCRRYHLGTTPPPTTTPAPPVYGCYNPTLAQPLTDGCVFWLGSVDTGGVVSFENKITGTPLVAPAPWAQQVVTTEDHPDYPLTPVFNLNGPDRSGGVKTGMVLSDSDIWTMTMMFKNEVFHSDGAKEFLFGGGDISTGAGQLSMHMNSSFDYVFEQDANPALTRTMEHTYYTPASNWRRLSVTSNSAGFKNFFLEHVGVGISSASLMSAEMMLFNQLIGGESAQSGYQGLVSDVRIYNRYLTDTELECFGSKGGEEGPG